MIEEQKDELINKYFNLNQSIKDTQFRIKLLRSRYYGVNLYTRNEADYDTGSLVVRTFRVEKEIVKFVDCIVDLETAIERNQKKIKYFNSFIETLPSEAQNYLNKRYIERQDITLQKDIEEATADEISEIEEAINFMYGFPPEDRNIEFEGDPEDDFQSTLNMFSY